MPHIEYLQTTGKDGTIRVVTGEQNAHLSRIDAIDAANAYLREEVDDPVKGKVERWVTISSGLGRIMAPDTYMFAEVSKERRQADLAIYERHSEEDSQSLPPVSLLDAEI